MKVITTNEAIEKIGIERFSSDIAYMSKETYNLWYENYYSYNLDEFPNWQKLHEYNMNKCTNIDSSFSCPFVFSDVGFSKKSRTLESDML